MNEANHNEILAESAARYLRNIGAENYAGVVFTIEFDTGAEQIEVLVTTQKVGAPTPHDLRIKAENQRDTLLVQLNEANELLKKLADIDFNQDFDRDYWQYLLGEVSLQLAATGGPTEAR
ncbi:hypothetical protein [Pseudomonas sp. HMWF021]|uniref:hypothetical protein n=1 Tax=Pseudomonas sp. HMWF021 TaxID=2056857 RepID=UPI000D3C59C8|nr:hypothetical protein [Pseudomonas sp. HMWF021]PTT31926.1 hypothetical protein DBR18_05960 [Pseudomonas sp. HMWF021]